jgi:hypothetical protein
LYKENNFSTGKRVLVLGDKILYWKESSCTGGLVSVLEGEFVYKENRLCTGKIILALGESFLYWKKNSCGE